MPEDGPRNAAADFEAALEAWRDVRFRLQLFITGTTARSVRAVETLKALCERYLPGRYELSVVDIYQQPELAQEQQLIAAPTLVKLFPPPLQRLVGDLSDEGRLLFCLGIMDADPQSAREDTDAGQ